MHGFGEVQQISAVLLWWLKFSVVVGCDPSKVPITQRAQTGISPVLLDPNFCSEAFYSIYKYLQRERIIPKLAHKRPWTNKGTGIVQSQESAKRPSTKVPIWNIIAEETAQNFLRPLVNVSEMHIAVNWFDIMLGGPAIVSYLQRALIALKIKTTWM